MTSIIKVDDVQNQPGTNIINKCGTDITLGQSGDTIAIASGATTSGMGRTGAVDWDTSSIKTATFSAVNGNGYFCNTSGGAFTVNLPAGVAGNIIGIVDYTNTFQTNALTISPDGSEKIAGIAADAELSTEGQSATLVYVDSTEGWKTVQDSVTSIEGGAYITATVSGTCNAITTCGDYKLATFKNPGTFCVSAGAGPKAMTDYLVVAGGGGGGSEYNASTAGGAAGGGGFRVQVACLGGPAGPLNGPAQIPISPGPYSIVAGGGGAYSSTPGTGGADGGVSTFSTITSAGGGGGGSAIGDPPAREGGDGGSGGGGSHGNGKGTGNEPPTTPPQGKDGGDSGGTFYLGGGGGGALVAGSISSPSGAPGGAGAGLPNVFGTNGQSCGSNYYFSGGGGGGGASNRPQTGPAGSGGLGGGAAGGAGGSPAPAAATAVTGGGGGGGGNYGTSPSGTHYHGSNGGSGVVVIRYKFQ